VFYGAFRSTDAGATWQPFAAALRSAPENFLFDPTDANAIYAVGLGLYKSGDGGVTWTNVGPTQAVGSPVSAAAIDPVNPSILYAAAPSTFCGFFCGVMPGAVFKSTDGGQNWAIKQQIRSANVIVDPNSPATVYVDNQKSTDGGETWTQLGGSEFLLAIDTNSNLYGYPLDASASTQIQMSSDGGQTWTVVYNASGSSPIAGFAVDPHSAGTLYVGGAAQTDAFVVKLDPVGNLIYTKFLGGSGPDHASAVAVDSSGAVYLAGMTASQDFPAVGPVLPYSPPLANFAARLDAATFAPTFSAFFGASSSYPENGVAVDPDGNIIIVGSTRSPNLPAVNAIQSQLVGASDAFVIKVKPD
jgi:hypothetical protein